MNVENSGSSVLRFGMCDSITLACLGAILRPLCSAFRLSMIHYDPL